jgi:hypothetical protein
MTDRRKGLLRGVGVLAALLLAAGAISPAFSATTLTRAKVKKIARKQINKLVPGMIAAADNVKETKYFTLTDGGSRVLITHGPFTVTADCDLDAAGQDIARILISTTQDNSSFDASDELDDFDVATPADERDWGSQVNVTADTLEVEDQTGVAIAPDGTTLVLLGSLTLTNRTPDTCGFAAAHLLA